MEIYLEPLLPVARCCTSSAPRRPPRPSPTWRPRSASSCERAAEGAAPAGATVAVVVHATAATSRPRSAPRSTPGSGSSASCAATPAAAALLAELATSPEEAARVHTHVGLDIGARTAPEIALSIMAAVVRGIRVEGLAAARPAPRRPGRAQAVDPVCGMTVTIGADTPHAVRGRRRPLVLPPGLPRPASWRRTRRERGRAGAGRRGLATARARPSSYSPSVARRCSTSPWPRPARRRSTRWSSRSAVPRTRSRARVDLTGIERGAQPRLRRRLRDLDPVGAGARAATTRRGSCCCSATSRASRVETIHALVAGARGHAVGVCAYDDGPGHPLWFDRQHVRRPFAACTATRPCGSWSTPARTWSGSRCRARCPATSTPGTTTRRCSEAAG